MNDAEEVDLNPDEPVGAVLARLRRARGLTIEQVGMRAGISLLLVSRIESGTASLTASSVRQLATAIGVDELVVRQLVARATSRG